MHPCARGISASMHVATTDLDCRFPRDDQRPRSASTTKTAVGCRQKQLFAPRFCPTKLKSTSSNLLGRPFTVFFGVEFAEHGFGFLEKGGLCFLFSNCVGMWLNTRFFSIFSTKSIDYNGFWHKMLQAASAAACRVFHAVRKARIQ